MNIPIPDHLSNIGADSQACRRIAEQWGISGFRFYNQTDSTQNIIRGLAESGAPAWTIAVADHQTAGRGQQGRAWFAGPGTSLMFSLLLRPLNPMAMSLLPIRMGLAVARAVDRFVGGHDRTSLQLKWPNDLILNDRKLGGILCEGVIRGVESFSIVGVGINVHTFANDIDGRTDIMPVFLDEVLQGEISRLEILGAIIDSIKQSRELYSEELSKAELTEFSTRDWLHGKLLESPVPGRAAGITRNGNLVIDRGNGQFETILSGRVVLKR